MCASEGPFFSLPAPLSAPPSRCARGEHDHTEAAASHTVTIQRCRPGVARPGADAG